MKMMKMEWLLCLCFLYFVGFSGADQESFALINLYDSTPTFLQALPHKTAAPVAVSVSHSDLNEVSSSILVAESWLRTQILPHYPATKITTIVVGDTILCSTNPNYKLGIILPSMKNIHHSLTRWGLEKEIKVSALFSSECLQANSAVYRENVAENVIKPLLSFLQTINSTYSVNPPPNFSPLSDETRRNLATSHFEFTKKLGFLELNKVNVVNRNTIESKPIKRKLSYMDSNLVEPYPSRPTPLPEISPVHSSKGYSVPANIVRKPLPPQASTALPPSMNFHFGPQLPPPFINPASPPFGLTLPPCGPSETGGGIAPVPPPKRGGTEQGLWCVAKPSVPAETLQEAMDYACGAGGADCEEIKPHGSCYFPDTIVAHASYAFNSYWQKNKRGGGTCSFGGTAMVINSDPSFLRCRFLLS